MERAYGLSIPRTLAEACDPARTAVLVYDLQVGVVSQVAGGAEIVERAGRVIDAARAGGYRVLYCRHMFLPLKLAGVNALRTAMIWQRTDKVDELKPFLTPGSPGSELVPELRPTEDELVFDKVTMSAFEGTPLDIVLRDCHIDTLVIVGIATEIGIEPTVRHGLDLGYLPILVTDACGHGDADAARRSLDTLRFAGGTLFTDTDELTGLLAGS
jgi:nicotinamidase-related amidase